MPKVKGMKTLAMTGRGLWGVSDGGPRDCSANQCRNKTQPWCNLGRVKWDHLLVTCMTDEKKPRNFCPSLLSAGPEEKQKSVLATQRLGSQPFKNENSESDPAKVHPKSTHHAPAGPPGFA